MFAPRQKKVVKSTSRRGAGRGRHAFHATQGYGDRHIQHRTRRTRRTDNARRAQEDDRVLEGPRRRRGVGRRRRGRFDDAIHVPSHYHGNGYLEKLQHVGDEMEMPNTHL